MNRNTLIALAVMASLTGCARLGQQAKERVDLGDGMIFDIIPVGLAASAADSAAPGAGQVIGLIEAQLKAKREARLGPFDGLPFSTSRQVVLKTGQIIPESEIERIVEVLTPIVPAPVVRVIAPAQFKTAPVQPTDAGLPTPDDGTETNLHPLIESALKAP